jgi:hypothetical protein
VHLIHTGKKSAVRINKYENNESPYLTSLLSSITLSATELSNT